MDKMFQMSREPFSAEMFILGVFAHDHASEVEKLTEQTNFATSVSQLPMVITSTKAYGRYDCEGNYKID